MWYGIGTYTSAVWENKGMAGGLKSAIVILTNHKITIKSDPKVLGILPSTSQLIDHGSPKISEYKIDQGAPKIA